MPRIELQVQMDRWQYPLEDHHVIRVWRVGSMELIAELSVPLLTQLVSHYLSQASLTSALLAQEPSERRPLASVPPRVRTLPLGAPSASERALRKAARRSRRPR
jgi:hypothetical protein